MARYEMNIEPSSSAKAHRAVQEAVRNGILVRPNECELCGDIVQVIITECEGRLFIRDFVIVGHHWAGYNRENWLNVWWICKRCNSRLGSTHDGSVSKKEASEFINDMGTWGKIEKWQDQTQ
jgi:hypothetical protein